MNRTMWMSALATAAATLAWSASAQAASWTENDAGSTLATAETVFDATAPVGTSLDHVVGTLTTTVDATDPSFAIAQTDLYRIFIANTATFSASTFNGRTGTSDTQLFLFDNLGHGVETNDDDPVNGPSSTLAFGSLSGLSAGYYYLGVGLSGATAFGTAGLVSHGIIFDPSTGTPDTSLTLAGFDPTTLYRGQSPTDYQIDLTGALVSSVPEPGTWLMFALGLAGVAARARRSRRAA